MSFPEIGIRSGIAATNSTSIQNISLSNFMSQDDVARLDSMIETAIEATSQETEENKTKKQEQLEASRKKLCVRVNKNTGTLLKIREPLHL